MGQCLLGVKWELMNRAYGHQHRSKPTLRHTVLIRVSDLERKETAGTGRDIWGGWGEDWLESNMTKIHCIHERNC